MKIVVGLGNPGPKYEQTRHNVGYHVIDELCQRLSAGKARARFDASVAEGNLGGEKVLLATPRTYMNESGRSVRQLIDFYGLQLPDLIVVCDENSRRLPTGETGEIVVRGGMVMREYWKQPELTEKEIGRAHV